MKLNDRQKEAVEYLDGPLLVLAGPGTGKTQLLSEKVAYILRETDTNPENILCMTFTESGAMNMRERLKSIVGKDGLKVNIGTYHAFGTEILARYKNYAVDYDRRLDSPIDEVRQYKIVKEIRDGLPAKDILRGDNVKDIISVISSAKSASLSASDLRTVAEQNIEDAEVLSKAISPLLEEIVPRNFEASYKNAYEPIYNILSNYIETKPIINKIERNISIITKELKTAISEAISSEKIKPLSSWKDAFFEKDAGGKYRLKERVANRKLLSVAEAMRRYDEYLRAEGLYDFDDMIQEAVRVLREDEGFRATLSERYQFIMLDEFQDTNPSQFMIIKLLTDYEKPLVMAVGDDDQAIYEFQGALSTNLTDFQEHYSANVIALTENYRSTQEILDFSREIIRQAPDRFADKELTAHKPNPEPSEIYRYEFRASEMEYAFIAKKIAELISNGVKQSEIAVIAYKRKNFAPLLPYLKEHPEIKIAYEKRDDLFEDDKIHQILTLAEYIYEVANEKRVDTPIMEILAYPFLKLPVLEVIKTVEKARRNKRSVLIELSESDNPKLVEVAEFFGRLIVRSATEPLTIFLEEIVAKIEAEISDPYERFKFYENLAALKGKVYKHFGEERRLKLAELIEMIRDYREAEMTLTVNSPYRDADEAVSILTAHKAKGLEFSYVFIISADHTAWGKGKGNNNLLVLPKNLAHIRHTGTTDGEKLRILYVALTRAKNTLYITNSLRDFNGKSPERLEYFEEYVKKDGEIEQVISPFLPTSNVRLEYDASVPEIAVNSLKNWFLPYFTESPDLFSLYRERAEKFRMSATALTSFIDIVYAGPEEFFKSYILGAPRGPETESLAFGDLIHKTFEKVTNSGLSDEEATAYFLEELNKKDLESETIAKLREKGPSDLSVSLAKFGEILRQGKAEVDLGVEKLVIDGVPVTGKIDHMTIDEDAKTIEIYDYKTGGYHKEKWHSHATLYKYMLQLGFYKLLLNSSPTYRKYTVSKAHILFVTPDKDDEVYDKVYEFNAEDEKELLDLIRVVYDLISSLKFMADKEIFVGKDETRGLKDIKEFIELLLAKK